MHAHQPLEVLQPWRQGVLGELAGHDHPFGGMAQGEACAVQLLCGELHVCDLLRLEAAAARSHGLLGLPPEPLLVIDHQNLVRVLLHEAVVLRGPVPGRVVEEAPPAGRILLLRLPPHTTRHHVNEIAVALLCQRRADPGHGVHRVIRLREVHDEVPGVLHERRKPFEQDLDPRPIKVVRVGRRLHMHIRQLAHAEAQRLFHPVWIQLGGVDHVQEEVKRRVQFVIHAADQWQLVLIAELHQKGEPQVDRGDDARGAPMRPLGQPLLQHGRGADAHGRG
mmetsp:Transcript_55107/g.167488  ORF Transcript_55107/g.167488 Transcript_55107/m.167488 type:complete len:279 (+) Transcript_55107:265-1101(+)